MNKRFSLPLALGLLFLALFSTGEHNIYHTIRELGLPFSTAFSVKQNQVAGGIRSAATPAAIPTVTGAPIVNYQATACPGAPAISNQPNTWAQISLHPPISNNVRSQPGLKEQRIGKLKPGEIVRIQDGPLCVDGYNWWFVRSLAGLEGWTAEGDAEGSWLLGLLDAFFYNTADQNAESQVVLNKGQKYRITMSGTYSVWIPGQWTDHGVCIRGKPELRPMYPSPKKTNGMVGADPYYRFARPFYGVCQYRTLLDPGETVSPIMFNLEGSDSYTIPVPKPARYRKDHTYTYQVIGQGYPLKIRLDDAPLDDNYGQILIAIEKIN